MANPLLQTRAALDEAHNALRGGEFPTAIRTAEAVLRGSRTNAEAMWVLATGLLAVGDTGGARETIQWAIKIAPRDAQMYQVLARVQTRAARFKEARQAIDRALVLKPGDPGLLTSKADLFLTLGEYQAARDLLEPIIDADIGLTTTATVYARACRHVGDPGRGAEVLERCIAQPGHGRMALMELCYDLGEIRDAMGEYDKAFAAFHAGNEHRREPFDPAAQSHAIEALVRAWTPAAIAALPRAVRTDRPVFVVGFWRSGTTLVEQTLSMHPDVAAGDELQFLGKWVFDRRDWLLQSAEPLMTNLSILTRPTVEKMSREYLAVLRGVSPQARRVTDKMPTNFVQLGLISIAFPRARVVHCLRDPVDTCLSCYCNLRGSLGYSHDLAYMGRFYRDYLRLMAHWKAVLDLPILDVVYEDFVADQEGNARRLVEFLGLPWNDACLRPHENRRVAMTRSIDQVRKPLYKSSVKRWKRYETHLGPLIEALGDAAR